MTSNGMISLRIPKPSAEIGLKNDPYLPPTLLSGITKCLRSWGVDAAQLRPENTEARMTRAAFAFIVARFDPWEPRQLRMRYRLRFHQRDLPRTLELCPKFPGAAVGEIAGDVYAAAPAGVTGGAECAAAEAWPQK